MHFGLKLKAMYEKTKNTFTDNSFSYSNPKTLLLKFNSIGVKIMPFTYLDDADALNYKGPGIHSKGYRTDAKTTVTESATSITTETVKTTRVVDEYISPGDINFMVRALASIYILKGVSYIHTSEPNEADQNINATISGWGFNPTWQLNSGITLICDMCFNLKYKWTDAKGVAKVFKSNYAGFSIGVPFKLFLKKK